VHGSVVAEKKAIDRLRGKKNPMPIEGQRGTPPRKLGRGEGKKRSERGEINKRGSITGLDQSAKRKMSTVCGPTKQAVSREHAKERQPARVTASKKKKGRIAAERGKRDLEMPVEKKKRRADEDHLVSPQPPEPRWICAKTLQAEDDGLSLRKNRCFAGGKKSVLARYS